MTTKQTIYQETMAEGPKMAKDMVKGAETTRVFLTDLADALKFLLQKGFWKSWERMKEEIKFLYGKFTAFDYVCGGVSFALWGLGMLIGAIGTGLLLYQVILWLQAGDWQAMPLMMVWTFLFEGTALHGWMMSPESWLGLHTILEWVLTNIPISVVLILGGAALSGFMVAVIVAALTIRRFQFMQQEKS
ncbi:hypothetical protein [Nitrospina gracilis]|uniref:hypothetical protein n=1 Tax=Nitrospina gracilis TaxID=35801 RepID=UPI001F262F0E|nr:hypothetical protein [Nitrospina gracilis]MCF8719579.1 hypothetical protein [Nitrospina gracilis Nb-211]